MSKNSKRNARRESERQAAKLLRKLIKQAEASDQLVPPPTPQVTAPMADEPPKKTSKKSDSKKRGALVKNFWAVVAAVIAVVGFVALVYEKYVPMISMAPSQTISPKDPYQTKFLLANNGKLSVHKVSYRCRVTSTAGGHLDMNVRDNSFDILKPGKPITIAPLTGARLGEAFWTGIYEIKLAYRPSFWPFMFEEPFRFRLARIATGELVWQPVAK